MDLIEFREYCLSLPLAEETTPFDDDTLVYKVCGKMFAMGGISDFGNINLKCDPERAMELRERHSEITPGYHMNKTHWNTVDTGGDLPDTMIREMIRDSYMLVVGSLPRTRREEVMRALRETEGDS